MLVARGRGNGRPCGGYVVQVLGDRFSSCQENVFPPSTSATLMTNSRWIATSENNTSFRYGCTRVRSFEGYNIARMNCAAHKNV